MADCVHSGGETEYVLLVLRIINNSKLKLSLRLSTMPWTCMGSSKERPTRSRPRHQMVVTVFSLRPPYPRDREDSFMLGPCLLLRHLVSRSGVRAVAVSSARVCTRNKPQANRGDLTDSASSGIECVYLRNSFFAVWKTSLALVFMC